MKLPVLLATLLLLTCSLVAQEVPVSRPELAELIYNGPPHIATDGHEFLAVWTDRSVSDRPVIYAARITAGGTLLDPFGIRVAEGTVSDLIWTGRSYLMTLTSQLGTLTMTLDSDVNVLTRNVLGSGWLFNLDLGTNGETALMAGDAIGARLDLDGRSLRSFRMANGSVEVASNGRDYLIAHQIGDDLYARKILADGTRLDSLLVASDVNPSDVAIESDGTNYLIAWIADGVFTQALDENGAPISAPNKLQTGAPSVGTRDLKIARDGDGYVVTHAVGSLLFQTRTTSSGEALGEPRVFALGSAPEAAVAGGTTVFVWHAERAGIRAGISRGGNALEQTIVLSRGLPPQRTPRITSAGDAIITTWVEQQELRIARLGGEPQVVSTIDDVVIHNQVVFDGRFVWVVWRDRDAFFVRRYTSELQAVDPRPLEYVIAMHSGWSAAPGVDGILIVLLGSGVRALALTVNGPALQATEMDVANPEQEKADSNPVAVWNGSEYVVAWIRGGYSWFPGNQLPMQILAARVTRNGVLLDPVPIEITDDEVDASVRSLKATRAHGGGAVLAWQRSNDTVAAIFRGDARPPAQVISDTSAGLIDILTLPGGYAMVWARYFYDIAGQQILTQRLDAALQPREPIRAVHIRSGTDGFDAAAIGEEIYVTYSRLDSGIATARAFVRHAVAAPRQRTVR